MNGLDQYRAYRVETVSPADQIVLLYEGAQRFIDKAAIALEQERYLEVSENVGKAQTIFAELTAALNPAAGEITQNLARLYDYWTWRLSQGLVRKDVTALREVSAMVADLAGAWAEAARQIRVRRAQTS